MLNCLHGVGFYHVQHDPLGRIQLCGEFCKSVGNVAAPGDGNPEALHRSITQLADFGHLVQLKHNIMGVSEKFLPLFRRNYPFGAADKNRKAHSILQFPDGLAQIGLRHIEVFRSLCNRTGLLHFNGIFEK